MSKQNVKPFYCVGRVMVLLTTAERRQLVAQTQGALRAKLQAAKVR